jgi:hypothetical protein
VNYREVNEILTDSAGALAYANTYLHGVLPDLNKEKALTYPLIYTTPFSISTGEFNKNLQVRTFNIGGFVLGKDAVNLDNSQWKGLVYDADDIFMDWLNKIYESTKDLEEVYISNYSVSPIIKDTTKILTGLSFTLTIVTTDTFNYCG